MSHMSNDPKQFEIEISNPFFGGSNLITLSDMTAPKVSSQVNNKPSSKEGGRGSQNGDAEKSQNCFELTCNPTKPAQYTCYVILKSLDRTDIRFYEYKLTAIPQKIKA